MTGFPFMMPNMMPNASNGEADALEMWTKTSRQAFEFWISFFPTAPLFGVEWRFANVADPAANPFMPGSMMGGMMSSVMAGMPGMMAGMPGMRAAAKASHPGELASPALADEDAEMPMARAADTAGEAATAMTRIAGETGKAAARSADMAMRAGAAATKTAVEAEARSMEVAGHVAEETGKAGRRVGRTAMTAAENAAKTVGNTAEQTARQTTGEATNVFELTDSTVRETTEAGGAGAADATADVVDAAIAAAPKPKMLLDSRPDEVDDLTAIKGIGSDLEQQLNDLGLYRFEQLAEMTDADLAWIDAHILRFKGRCFRDDWVGQAKSRRAE